MGIIIAILVFSFLIVTHEMGHCIMAKRCGIGVIEFSVGMGPRLLHTEKGGTIYSLKLIPFGGSCLMVGEDEDCDAENSFQKKSVWARILVVAGGPLSNFLCAFLLAMIIVCGEGANTSVVYQVAEDYGAGAAGIEVGDVITKINDQKITVGRDIELYFFEYELDGSPVEITYERDGEIYTVTMDPYYSAYRMGITYMTDSSTAELSAVSEDSAAEAAGLEAGDVIVAVDGTEITTGASLQAYFEDYPVSSDPITITYERDGETYEVTLTPTLYETYATGMSASYYREKVGPLASLQAGFYEMGYSVRTVLVSLKMLVTGAVGLDQMSGPVGIVSTIDEIVDESSSSGAYYVFMNVVSLSILFSANLGVFNLLPIPALDGGRLVFLFVEAVRGKPVPPEKEGMVHTVGFALLMVLMVFVFYNDIMRLIG